MILPVYLRILRRQSNQPTNIFIGTYVFLPPVREGLSIFMWQKTAYVSVDVSLLSYFEHFFWTVQGFQVGVSLLFENTSDYSTP